MTISVVICMESCLNLEIKSNVVKYKIVIYTYAYVRMNLIAKYMHVKI